MGRGLLRVVWIWGPLALYVFTIFYLSSQSQIGWLAGYPDYLTHPIEYAGLAILVARALNDGLSQPPPARRFLHAFLLCLLCALADESWQYLTPDRLADWGDVLKDGAGATLGLGLLRLAVPLLSRSGLA